VGFEKSAEGQIRVPETPSQNPADNRENRQGIQNKGNHKFLFIPGELVGKLFPQTLKFSWLQHNLHGQLKQSCLW
jgi:hypothetical protein